MVTLAWVGYVGTDDQAYAKGALGWLTDFLTSGTLIGHSGIPL